MGSVLMLKTAKANTADSASRLLRRPVNPDRHSTTDQPATAASRKAAKTRRTAKVSSLCAFASLRESRSPHPCENFLAPSAARSYKPKPLGLENCHASQSRAVAEQITAPPLCPRADQPASRRSHHPTTTTFTTFHVAIGSAIASTSNNTNSVQTLDSPFSDPDMESLRQKLNELINALRR
jgi:hypothetical protein